jgi:hypothetical protein
LLSGNPLVLVHHHHQLTPLLLTAEASLYPQLQLLCGLELLAVLLSALELSRTLLLQQ